MKIIEFCNQSIASPDLLDLAEMPALFLSLVSSPKDENGGAKNSRNKTRKKN